MPLSDRQESVSALSAGRGIFCLVFGPNEWSGEPEIYMCIESSRESQPVGGKILPEAEKIGRREVYKRQGINWLVILALVSPAISLIAVTLIVRGSAKAQTVEESQQSAVFLILPVILLVVGQTTGLMLVNGWVLLGLGVVCGLIAFLMLKMCMGRFTYEMLLK